MANTKSTLYPGAKVSIGEGEGETTALVFPLGVRHIKRFAGFLDRIIPEISKVAANFAPGSAAASDPDGPDAKAATADAFQTILPIILEEGLDLLGECVELPEGVTIEDLAHFDIARIATVWIEDSFSEKKRGAWSAVLKGGRLVGLGT